MILQEKICQVGVEIVAGPSGGENVILVGPDLPGKKYKINPWLITMVKENIFRGYATECPYMHITKFDLACGNFQLQDLTNDEIKAKIRLRSYQMVETPAREHLEELVRIVKSVLYSLLSSRKIIYNKKENL